MKSLLAIVLITCGIGPSTAQGVLTLVGVLLLVFVIHDLQTELKVRRRVA